MNLLKLKDLALASLLALLTLIAAGYSYSTQEPVVQVTEVQTETAAAPALPQTDETNQINPKVQESLKETSKKAPSSSKSSKIKTEEAFTGFIKARYVFNSERKGGKGFTPVSVYIGNTEVFKITHPAGGLNPEQRAKIAASNINSLIKNGAGIDNIVPDYISGSGVVKAGEKVLFTVDSNIAGEYGMKPCELAFIWTNNIRDALGVARIARDFKLLTTSLKKTPKFFIQKYGDFRQTGYASWYGGNFHGRNTADGSKYDNNAYTAAHKNLPFGSVVQVTNLYNGKKCIVKITDRGPFIRGRIIDLSKIAAKEIGMISSGVSKVKIEVIGKV